MNKFFKAAVDRYKQHHKNTKIHPISKIDGEILTEIIEIFDKLDKTELKEILSNYKFLKDEAIRDLLLQWNIDNSKYDSDGNLNSKEEEPSSDPTKQILKIGRIYLKLSELRGVAVYEEDLKIVINPTNADVFKDRLSNSVVKFTNLERYYAALNTLEDFLGEENVTYL